MKLHKMYDWGMGAYCGQKNAEAASCNEAVSCVRCQGILSATILVWAENSNTLMLQKYYPEGEVCERDRYPWEKNSAAVALGKLGGVAKSEAKSKASAANGKKGGRPRKAGK